jgi:hypothetical protein
MYDHLPGAEKGDRPSLSLMLAIGFTFDLATVTVLSILKWRG